MYFYKKVIFILISILNRIFKKGKIIVFSSFPDVADNSFAVFDYLIKNEKDKEYLMAWLIDDYSKIDKINKNIYERFGNISVKYIKKNSFLGIYYYIFSRYIFCTHGIFSGVTLCKKQIKINLWHAMPTKRIGLLDNKKKEDIATSNYMTATSDIFVNLLAKAFGMDEKNILKIGQPRNDLLFRGDNSLRKIGIDKEQYNKVFLWMPTYRVSTRGDIRTDGKIKESGLPLLDQEEIIKLNDLLFKENFLFVIKLHPIAQVTIKYFDNLSNIIFISDEILIDSNVQLYSIIGECGVLLTDYSSVYIDYLILNRPIGFIIDDLEDYKNNRGFVFDNFEEWAPGKKIRTFRELENFILDVKNNIDEYKEIREKINKKFNKFVDGESSKRLIKFLNI
ncbi:MAG: CDP-glycerol glycerophosphotransferase family protein [Candidatus Lokiarchaeota archaeon]|nr:CDP-glycerol glycerophosphotransferase family protein [Candidatus Lokiarchaeota archaeon]